ncbi:hypothetical protein [Pelistega ratti]|uniref:hypothetical protein n=1 Tax=Pelistega ratti TaxID=2652177 RepID=UPI0013572664|nr:hypothetical protein [Pelistega ratti]
MIQQNNDDKKGLSIDGVDKQIDRQENDVGADKERLLSIEKNWVFRFFVYFVTILFSLNFIFIIQKDDYRWEFFRSLLDNEKGFSESIPLSLLVAILRTWLHKYPLVIFVCNVFLVFFISAFFVNLVEAFGSRMQTVDMITYVLYGLFILVVIEAVISFYSKSYLQNYLYQKGYKGYFSILGSYIVSLYLVLMATIFVFIRYFPIDTKDLWIMVYQQFLLFLPLVICLAFIRYKLPRLKANSLNLVIFCIIAFLASYFLGEDAYQEWQQASESLITLLVPYWGTSYGIANVVLWFLVGEGILFLVLLWQDLVQKSKG